MEMGVPLLGIGEKTLRFRYDTYLTTIFLLPDPVPTPKGKKVMCAGQWS